jgi:hypothetical protein
MGADRKNVLPRQFREVRIGEGRIVARAVTRHPISQSTVEIVVAPRAEPGLAIRRQVGRIDTAEGGIDPFSAGKRPRRIGGVAACAIAGLGQRLAARDVLGSRLGLWLGA